LEWCTHSNGYSVPHDVYGDSEVERFKNSLSWILTKGRNTGSLSTAELRKIAVLGVNIMQVYQDAKCYLKGIFNAIEAFCSDGNSQGRRVETVINSAAFLDYSVGRSVESPLDLPRE
jgi:hypothetical protein